MINKIYINQIKLTINYFENSFIINFNFDEKIDDSNF